MQWRNNPCESVELAVAPQRHGHGLGRAIVAWLVEEAQRRGKSAVLVGTANAGIGQITFYQKCGFRMDHVRKDYFWYLRESAYEDGIQIRDMIVFRYNLSQ
jgi:GNAT superfamily N-acetyltransferase